ncbi:hypothetical protein WJX74_004904 [Apatococcus lobatus]|uniref:Uncharacterized protein n=1 Tax=Apatococcus lobatus TaxID=904363 RepID=A0AAW1RIY5_9CHLO
MPEKRVPPGLAWSDPFRFGPLCRPSDEDLDRASAFAEAQKRFTSALETQRSLDALLSCRDWCLLQWKDKRLLHLAAQEGIGPHFSYTAAKSPELQRLMKRRECAWLIAFKLMMHWDIVNAATVSLRRAYLALWPGSSLDGIGVLDGSTIFCPPRQAEHAAANLFIMSAG